MPVRFSGARKGVSGRRVVGGARARICVVVGAAFVLLASGCGKSASIVKENLDYKPLVTKAFSRAASIGSEVKKVASPSPKPASANSFPDIPPDEDNARVRRFVREYAYDSRETMKRYLARAEPYLPMVKAITRENGLPEDVAYLFLLESGGNPEARSPANALGMWQFMADTGRSYGLRVDRWVDERLDPQKATKAAMLYLKDLYGMFGCWRLALSAYNSGESKLNQVLCQEDADCYEEICSSRRLKRETREFFPRFHAIAHIAKDPERYGFKRVNSKYEEPKHDLVPVQGAFSVATLAKALGLKSEELADLNPALTRGMTPTEGPAYPLRVPLGKGQLLAQKLDSMAPDPAGSHKVHVVGRGENLNGILRQYGVLRQQVADLNPDVNLRRKLRPGAKILIPVEKTHTKTTLRKGARVSTSDPNLFRPSFALLTIDNPR